METVANFIETNFIPLSFVILLLAQFVSMLIDRWDSRLGYGIHCAFVQFISCVMHYTVHSIKQYTVWC